MSNKYKVIGLMSGTSLDGVDIAFCHFSKEKKWSFQLIHAETISYKNEWKKRLAECQNMSGRELSQTDAEYGTFLGSLVKSFCRKHKVNPDFISSHGHTIFHQPHLGFTTQIGSGSHLLAAASFPVVCDFRTVDVALGGQGAPLVPIGDKYLFPKYDYCLNLGGIANISYDERNKRKAFDICPCNILLNHFAAKAGAEYDENGKMASVGTINKKLLSELNSRRFYSKKIPKSMGREEIDSDFLPLLESYNLLSNDVLATLCEHIALQISHVTSKSKTSKQMLITGGGAFNNFLIERIRTLNRVEVEIPEEKIIAFKEAIIFAFLGVLRMRKEINCLKSVTGARLDSSGGAIYTP